jgi:ADP-heptose:LPS heptosyltransferase
VETGKLLLKEFPCQLLLTGSLSEASQINKIHSAIGENSFSLAGKLKLEEFITLMRHCSLVISVNTATIHIAAAIGIPIIVLYALTNPQHTPWKVRGEILPFKVPEKLKSQNEVVKFVDDNLFNTQVTTPMPNEIVESAKRVLEQNNVKFIPEIVFARNAELQTIGKFSWLPADRYFDIDG